LADLLRAAHRWLCAEVLEIRLAAYPGLAAIRSRVRPLAYPREVESTRKLITHTAAASLQLHFDCQQSARPCRTSLFGRLLLDVVGRSR
jgi:hypothetical protein